MQLFYWMKTHATRLVFANCQTQHNHCVCKLSNTTYALCLQAAKHKMCLQAVQHKMCLQAVQHKMCLQAGLCTFFLNRIYVYLYRIPTVKARYNIRFISPAVASLICIKTSGIRVRKKSYRFSEFIQ